MSIPGENRREVVRPELSDEEGSGSRRPGGAVVVASNTPRLAPVLFEDGCVEGRVHRVGVTGGCEPSASEQEAGKNAVWTLTAIVVPE